LESLKNLESLNLGLACWENINKEVLISFSVSLGKLKKLKELHLHLQCWGNENTDIEDVTF